MDDISPGSIIALFALIIIAAIVSLAYASLLNTRRSELKERAEAGNGSAKRILQLLGSPARLSITYKLSSLLLYFAIVGITITGIVQPLLNNGTIPAGTELVLIILMVAITLILTDLVPEGVGSAYSNILAPIFVYPMSWMALILSPFTAILLRFSQSLAALFGSRLVTTITEEEIMTLIDAGHTGGTIEENEKEMIYSVLQLDETSAREIMTPRIDIVGIDVTATVGEALNSFIESGFSRIPVHEENIDNIVGVLYAKDILRLLSNGNADSYKQKVVQEFMRPAHFVYENMPADDLLKEMRERNVHIAIVADEYGGTSGLVTIENLLEEIVGDIRDEYDFNEEEEYILDKDGGYIIDAGMDLDDVNDLLDIDLDIEGADTLGGYLYIMLGHIPEKDEMIETDKLEMRILSLEGRRIRKVRVIKKRVDVDEDTTPIQPPEEVVNAP